MHKYFTCKNYIMINGDILIKKKFKRTDKFVPNLGWFSVSHTLIPDKILRRKIHSKWFVINHKKTNIYRMLSFSPILKHSNEDEIAIDWSGFLDLLDNDPNGEKNIIDLEIRNATFIEVILANLKHPDQGHRAAYKLGFLSLLISLISLISLF